VKLGGRLGHLSWLSVSCFHPYIIYDCKIVLAQLLACVKLEVTRMITLDSSRCSRCINFIVLTRLN